MMMLARDGAMLTARLNATDDGGRGMFRVWIGQVPRHRISGRR
jgi:hypothetical protein